MRTENSVQEYAQKFASAKYSEIQDPDPYFRTWANILERMGPAPQTEDPLVIIGQHRTRVAQAGNWRGNRS